MSLVLVVAAVGLCFQSGKIRPALFTPLIEVFLPASGAAVDRLLAAGCPNEPLPEFYCLGRLFRRCVAAGTALVYVPFIIVAAMMVLEDFQAEPLQLLVDFLQNLLRKHFPIDCADAVIALEVFESLLVFLVAVRIDNQFYQTHGSTFSYLLNMRRPTSTAASSTVSDSLHGAVGDAPDAERQVLNDLHLLMAWLLYRLFPSRVR